MKNYQILVAILMIAPTLQGATQDSYAACKKYYQDQGEKITPPDCDRFIPNNRRI